VIGVDTNALLRWLLADILPPEDAPQVMAISAQIDATAEPVFVSAVVMAELIWLLRSHLRLDRAGIGAVVAGILADTRTVVEHAGALAAALRTFTGGRAGFVDHLIGEIGRASRVRTTLTFDRDAGRLDTFTLLAKEN
jgi:predicted nucleic-acid-binding protein